MNLKADKFWREMLEKFKSSRKSFKAFQLNLQKLRKLSKFQLFSFSFEFKATAIKTNVNYSWNSKHLHRYQSFPTWNLIFRKLRKTDKLSKSKDRSTESSFFLTDSRFSESYQSHLIYNLKFTLEGFFSESLLSARKAFCKMQSTGDWENKIKAKKVSWWVFLFITPAFG